MHISAALPLLLRLRGGADIPDGTGTSTGLRLSREEITAKLNRVPTFCIMQGDGSVISLPDPAGAEGDECCTWFTDAAEAQYTFKRVCAANPELVDEGLRLQTHGLGDVFAMCGGWPREEGEATTEVTLRIKGPSALLKPVESQLVDALRQQGLEPGSWRECSPVTSHTLPRHRQHRTADRSTRHAATPQAYPSSSARSWRRRHQPRRGRRVVRPHDRRAVLVVPQLCEPGPPWAGLRPQAVPRTRDAPLIRPAADRGLHSGPETRPTSPEIRPTSLSPQPYRSPSGDPGQAEAAMTRLPVFFNPYQVQP